MTSLAENIWVDHGPVRILGMKLTSTMTVIRLPGGGLLLHSPVKLTTERRAEVEALGQVTHIYAPSRYHETWTSEWTAAFPGAKLHAPGALVRERPDLRIDRVIGSEPEPEFASLITEHGIDGFRVDETALIYEPARTLIVADLVHNVGRPQEPWTKFYTRAMGFYDRIALSRAIRWTAFSDRTAARQSIDALLTHDLDTLIVGHGQPVVGDIHEAISGAFTWLPEVDGEGEK